MSVVTEHLEQRGAAFEALAHRQAYTSIDEARALGGCPAVSLVPGSEWARWLRICHGE
jgi:hypothetical protein